MKKLLIATKNPAKLAEISKFLLDLPVILISLKDAGINDDVAEDGKDYFENSKKKALFYAKLSNLPTLSDDGGLEIDALGGAPGIKSRRWLGYEATDEELIEYMKKIAKDLPDNNRIAYFRTVVTLAFPNGKIFQEEGEVKGIIAKKPFMKKLHGYPFRSFFFIPQLDKYYFEGELTAQEMKKYNHRSLAINKLKVKIREL